MKTLYLDLPMGAAGDMLSAALYELLSDEEKIKSIVLADKKVQKYTASGIKKTIFVPNAKILNIVV